MSQNQPPQPGHPGGHHPHAGGPHDPQGPPRPPYGHPVPSGQQPWGAGPQPGPNGYGMPPGAPHPAPPKRKSIFKRWWFWVGVVVLLVIVGSCAGGGGEQQASDAGQDAAGEQDVEQRAPAEEEGGGEDAAEDAAAAEAPEEKSAGIGEPVASGDFEVTVSDVESGVSSVGDDMFGAEAQGQFVVVSMEVTNVGDSPVMFFSSDVELTDAEGRTYAADEGSAMYLEDSNSFLEEINPGNTVDGIVLFDVPEGVEPDTLVFRGGLFDEPIEIAIG
ncbi:DUF4352 domain-containing protein [Brevibacterium sp. NPDC049920]